jgi:hypothetical protein
MSTMAGLLKAASPIYEDPSIQVGSGSGFGGTSGVLGAGGSIGYLGSKAPLHKTNLKLDNLPL